MFSDLLKMLKPYVAGEQPADKKYIKLNTNESPYGPSPKVEQAVKNADFSRLRLYPDGNCNALRREIASYENLDIDNIFAGNGSDEVLAFCFAAYYSMNSAPAICDITYSFYPVYCDFFRLKPLFVPLKADFTIDADLLKKGEGAVIANPNAPTGIAASNEVLLDIIKNCNGIVIVDEAYIDFASNATTLSAFVNQYKNLVVVKTLSKSYSLAGLRCGYAVACPECIKALFAIKDSFNSYTMDMLTQIAAQAAISDVEYYKDKIQKIKSARDNLTKSLRALGCRVLGNDANFLLVSHDNLDGKETYLKLKEQAILVRHFNQQRINNFIRVTIGTPEQCDEFFKAYKNLL